MSHRQGYQSLSKWLARNWRRTESTAKFHCDGSLLVVYLFWVSPTSDDHVWRKNCRPWKRRTSGLQNIGIVDALEAIEGVKVVRGKLAVGVRSALSSCSKEYRNLSKMTTARWRRRCRDLKVSSYFLREATCWATFLRALERLYCEFLQQTASQSGSLRCPAYTITPL